MEDKNVKQKEFWSGAGGDVWVDKQREMDIMLNPLGKNAINKIDFSDKLTIFCLLYTSPSPRDQRGSRMPSSA